MINTINYKEQLCEELNKKQINIYDEQIKLIDRNVCVKCKDKFWEDIDLVLKQYYYDQVEQDQDLLPFDLNLIKKKIRCKKCSNHWKQYIEMDDQRFRLDLKKMKCYKELQVLENNEQMLSKFI